MRHATRWACLTLAVASSAAAQLARFEMYAAVDVDGPLGTGVPGMHFSGFGNTGMLSRERIAFGARVNITLDSVWVVGPESREAVVIQGEQVQGLPAGVRWNNLGSLNRLAARGDTLAFSALVLGPGYTANTGTGLWVWRDGELVHAARGGNLAPGAPGGRFRNLYENISVLDSGDVLFAAVISGSGYDGSNNSGWWRWSRSGGITPIVRGGVALAGTTPPAIPYVVGISSTPGGKQVLVATMQNPTPPWDGVTAYFVQGEGDTWVEAFRKGQQAPGCGTGVVFDTVKKLVPLDTGGFMMTCVVTGPGVTPNNNVGLWRFERGQLEMLFRLRNASPYPDMPGEINDIAFAANASGALCLFVGISPVEGPGSGVLSLGTWESRRIISRTPAFFVEAPSGRELKGYFSPTMGPGGHVVIELLGTGVTSGEDARSFWSIDPDGEVSVLSSPPSGPYLRYTKAVGDDLSSSGWNATSYDDGGRLALWTTRGIEFVTPLRPCPGDFNRDGTTDFFDYDEFVRCFEGSNCSPLTALDLDRNETVDWADYELFVEEFEAGCGGVGAGDSAGGEAHFVNFE